MSVPVWAASVAVMVVGLALVAIGVFGPGSHQELIVLGASTVSAGVGHIVGASGVTTPQPPASR